MKSLPAWEKTPRTGRILRDSGPGTPPVITDMWGGRRRGGRTIIPASRVFGCRDTRSAGGHPCDFAANLARFAANVPGQQ